MVDKAKLIEFLEEHRTPHRPWCPFTEDPEVGKCRCDYENENAEIDQLLRIVAAHRMCRDCGKELTDETAQDAGEGWWNGFEKDAEYCESCYESLMETLSE